MSDVSELVGPCAPPALNVVTIEGPAGLFASAARKRIESEGRSAVT
jgi:hypothetical protein